MLLQDKDRNVERCSACWKSPIRFRAHCKMNSRNVAVHNFGKYDAKAEGLKYSAISDRDIGGDYKWNLWTAPKFVKNSNSAETVKKGSQRL